MNVTLRANVGLKISSKTMANGNDDTIVKIQKSLSVRNDKLAKILNSKTFQPLFIDTNGTSPSSIGTSSNICDDENVQPQSNNEGDFDMMSVLFSSFDFALLVVVFLFFINFSHKKLLNIVIVASK